MKSFYDDELLATVRPLPTVSSAVLDQSQVTAVHQNLSEGSVNIMLSGPSAPNQAYQVHSTPPQLQELQEAGRQHNCNGAIPVLVASNVYPQLQYGRPRHNGIEPHFQVMHEIIR